MSKTEGSKNNKKNNKKNIKTKRSVKIFFRTFFILMLLFFFVSVGLGLNAVLSITDDAPDFDPRQFNQPLTSHYYDYNNNEITAQHDGHNRIEVSLNEIPEHLQEAFIAVEDERFYDHIGVSPKDILRAVYNNLLEKRLTDQGASTITQQLIKNTFLTPEKTFQRKIQEAWMAVNMEQKYSKREILEFYLNIIYFGDLNYGVEAAAQDYFEKNISEITLAEAALLAGIPRNPTKYSPRRNFEEAKHRQEIILNRMVECGYITESEASRAKEEPIELAEGAERTFEYPHFLDYVEREAEKILKELDIYEDPVQALSQGGLKIYTTLIPETQLMVEEIIDDEQYYPTTIEDEQGKLQPQAAAVLAEPETGYLRALVGGRDYGLHNQDLRVLSRRQPGSAIKPVLAYAPSIEEGIIFPGTVLDDAPITLGNHYWENYDRVFRGLVTMRQALTHSYNIPAVKAYSQLGTDKGMEYAEKLGISTFVKTGDPSDMGALSLAIGGFTDGVRPLDMAQAFAVFANKGVKTPLTSILKIENHQGQEIYSHNPTPEIVLSETTAYLITDVLKDVVKRGTAPELNALGRPVAAKTGTTSENKDGWLVSYTPDYVLSAWIGYDVLTMGSIRGATEYPRRMSAEIMKNIHEELPAREFENPGGLTRVTICSKSGLPPSEECSEDHITSDMFPRGSAPRGECDICVTMEVCAESGLLPTEFCPEVEEKSFIERKEPYEPTDGNWRGGAGRVPRDAELEVPEEACEIHTEGPSAPHDLEIMSFPTGEEVYLTWEHTENKVEGFNIYRQKVDEKEYTRINKDLVTVNYFTDRYVSPEETYHYKIMAVNEIGVESLPLLGSIKTHKNGDDPEDSPPEENGENDHSENSEDDDDSEDTNEDDNGDNEENGN